MPRSAIDFPPPVRERTRVNVLERGHCKFARSAETSAGEGMEHAEQARRYAQAEFEDRLGFSRTRQKRRVHFFLRFGSSG
jgi:hypothetical protein